MGIDELSLKQDELAVAIQKTIANYKKAPHDRRSVEFIASKARELDSLWVNFDKLDNVIRDQHGKEVNHPYFVKDIHSAIRLKYREARDEMDRAEQAIKLVQATSTLKTGTEVLDTVRSPQPATRQIETNSVVTATRSSSSQLSSLIDKQKKSIDTTLKLLNQALNNVTQQTSQYYAMQAKTIEMHWKSAQDLHQKIWLADEPSNYDYEGFAQTEQTITAKILQLQDMAQESAPSTIQAPATVINRQTANMTTSGLKLPKVELPKFDGSYHKWRQFHDLFIELVDKQPIPACQKMWFLKSSLSGQAEGLIRHFTASASDYEPAWTVVKDRYENPRLLINATLSRLLSQPIISNDQATAIKLLHDTTKECIMTLQGLGVDTVSWNPILMYILTQNLHKTTHALWEQSLKQPKEIPSLDEFLKFLELRFQSLEALGGRPNNNVTEQGRRKTYQALSVSVASGSTCITCNQHHALFQCQDFLKMTPGQRLNAVQKAKYCVNCLKGGHNAKSCTSSTCTKCNKKHNTLLHLGSSQGTQASCRVNQSQSPETRQGSPVSLTAVQDLPIRSTTVLLSTISVTIIDKWGHQIHCRALLDNGSQANFITRRLVNKLGIRKSQCIMGIEGIGQTQSRIAERVNLQLQSRTTGFSKRIEAHILPEIVSKQPSSNINIANWNIPSNLQLADPNFYESRGIDLLIGAGIFYSTLCVGQIPLGEGQPVLQNTLFGWIVGGEYTNQNSSTTTSTCGICTTDESLNETMEKFWRLEECDSRVANLTAAERRCEEDFLQNTYQFTDGRFVVKLPFQLNPSQLGESKDIALQRFTAIERKLVKNSELKTQYVAFMQEYERLGHMKEIAVNSIKGPHYFLPHHAVIKPDSSTTKLRVVFDASAKTSTNLSLNEVLATGPAIQEDVVTTLLRFRLPRFAFTADIEKMYRQVWVHNDHQQYQLIWWREDPSHPLKCYKLTTITYGTTSAPYLAMRTLQALAEKQAKRYPLAAEVVKANFYVDDVLSGSDQITTALEMQRQLRCMLGSAGFNLRKWCANHPKLLQDIPPKDQEVTLDFNNSLNESIKTMGLTWNPKNDNFKLKILATIDQRITKRTALAEISRIFDPLGFIAPVTTTAKIFLQQLWKLKIDWDAALPQDLHTTWLRFKTDFDLLQDISIPRHIFGHKEANNPQVHIFADASERAYGAVAYMRTTDANHTKIVRFICAKSRVAPTKQITLPRLELCAAKLAVELMQKLQESQIIKESVVHFWSDSTAVLGWINADSSHYHTFVANRISGIQQLTSPQQWRHVRSEDNPADLISRGLTPSKLINNNFWLYGPLFLHGAVTSWPLQPPREECPLERRLKSVVATSATTTNTTANWLGEINHKNSFRHLQRIMAYVLRFITHTRNQSTKAATTTLSAEEMEEALVRIIKIIQREEFSNDIKQLARYSMVNNNSPINTLTPFLDDKGMLRVGGRLESSKLSYDARHPMLLPYNNIVTKLLLNDLHKENLHAGPQTLISITRQRFWPLKLKTLARSVTQHCVQCARAKPKLLQQLMGNLPAERVQPARPFVTSGVDFFGPIWTHFKIRGKPPLKAYVAVFCCFATKAVHMELVSDLTTEAFIGALRRFMARRGHCTTLYCDNATNFVGARNQLQELQSIIHDDNSQRKIKNECNTKGINFEFIPPRAPHFGGLWEAAVKSAKNLLQKTLASASLTYEEMGTILAEAEAIMNSRPITPISTNPNDFQALTPGHFLIGEPLTSTIDPSTQPNNTKNHTRWKLVMQLKAEFWRRWSSEYLHNLQHRYKWHHESRNIKPGTMVIIKDDNLPPLKWPLGRISKVIRGHDGLVRVVDVRTATGISRRAVHKLAPLPVDEDTTDDKEGASAPSRTPPPSTTSEPAVPPKRMRLPQLALNNIVLITLFILPLIIGSPIEVTQFNKSSGIHFEAIGNIKLVTKEWNLIVFYDMAPFRAELQSLTNGTSFLSQLCDQIHKRTTCTILVDQFMRAQEELKQENSLFYAKKRHARGAIDLIGNIGHSLFGILDSEYATKMSQTIDKVHSNEEHVRSLLKSQTSIMNSTINIMKQHQNGTNIKLGMIEHQIEEIAIRINITSAEEAQDKTYRLLLSLAVQMILTLSNLQRIQSLLLDVLIDTHHGRIHPMLISPQQCQQEIMSIKNHLPSEFQLPVEHDELLSFYKLMTVKGGISADYVIFDIKIPLVSQELFEVFKVIPIPVVINNTMITIKPTTTLMAVNLHRDRYFPTSSTTLKQCSQAKEDTFLCANIHSIYNKGAGEQSCEINLLNNETITSCEFTKTSSKETWIQMEHANQWIFAVSSTRMSAVCSNEVFQVALTGSGWLSMQPDCTLKNDFITIQGHFIVTSSTHLSYTKFGFMSELDRSNNNEPFLLDVKETAVEDQINQLTALQNEIANLRIEDSNNIQPHDIHQYIISYSCIFIIICIVAWSIWKRIKKLRSIARSTPQPAPRTNINSPSIDHEQEPQVITTYGR